MEGGRENMNATDNVTVEDGCLIVLCSCVSLVGMVEGKRRVWFRVNAIVRMVQGKRTRNHAHPRVLKQTNTLKHTHTYAFVPNMRINTQLCLMAG